MSFYDSNKNIYWIHVPKNCGSSIRTSIWNDPEGRLHTHYRIDQLINKYGLDTLKNAYGFSVTRNPYDRLISSYHELKKWHNFNIYENFDDFILNDFEKNGKIDYRHSKSCQGVMNHFVPQTEFLISDKLNINFLLRFENFEEDWKKLCSVIGNYKIENVNNASAYRKNWKEYYRTNKEQKINIVKKIYEEDFINFDYSFEI